MSVKTTLLVLLLTLAPTALLADDAATKLDDQAPAVQRPPRLARPKSFIPRRAVAQLQQTLFSSLRFKDRDEPSLRRARLGSLRSSLQFGLPLYLGDELKLFSGLNLTRTDYDYEGSSLLNDSDLYSLTLPLSANIPINDDWSLLNILSLRMQSDLRDIDREDFGFFGVLSARLRVSETLTLNFGVVASIGFDNDFAFPALGLTWNPNEHWQLNLGAPRPRLSYAPFYGLHIYAEASFLPGFWRVQEPDFQGQEQAFFLDRSGFQSGLGFEWEIIPGFWIQLGGGATLANELIIENDDITLVDSPLREGYYLQWGLLWRPRRDGPS